MAGIDKRRKPQAGAFPPDLDATRLASTPGVNRDSASQTLEDYPTAIATPAAMSPAYSASAYANPGYPEPPRQPVMSPPPAAYSPFPGYSSPAAQSVPPSTPLPETPPRNWGIIGVSVLAVVALIALAIGATWLFTSKGQAKEGAAASQSQSESTQTNTVLETTVTATQAPRQAPNRVPVQTGKPIPASAVEVYSGFITPTGNIYCFMLGNDVFCQIDERQWETGCNDWWVMKITPSGIEQVCENEGWVGGMIEASYGTVYYNGYYACEVGKYTGVNCWDSRTGHGFTMRQADHSTY